MSKQRSAKTPNGQSYSVEVAEAADDQRAEAIILDSKHYTSGSEDAALQVVPTLPAASTQLSFAAAGSQFNTLAQFASEKVVAISTEDRIRADQRQEKFRKAFVLDGSVSIDPNGEIFSIFVYSQAVNAIQAKAAALGYGAQSQSVPVTGVPGGYVGRYPNNDIYSSPGSPAVEVHGAIRAKYEALGGAAGPLGLPTTDESGAPDGVGRFNHFQHGSIYWTPRTGPMMVGGTVRNRWAASGWERGPLGYPVQDQHRMALRGPLPLVEWCIFENGAIAGDVRSALPVPMALQSTSETLGRIAPPALLTYAELGAIFGNRFNEQFKASPDNVALHHGVDLTGVSDWQYGFWASTPRSVGFRLRGFHDNGLAPDTNFAIDIRLRFQVVAQGGPSFTEPVQKSLIAVLDYLNVGHDGGLALAQVYASVESAILHTFYSSDGGPVDPGHPEVPSGAIYIADFPTGANAITGEIDLLDVLVTATGDLQVLVNPLTPPQNPLDSTSYAYLRQLKVQDRLNDLA
jgi:LGFP repeat